MPTYTENNKSKYNIKTKYKGHMANAQVKNTRRKANTNLQNKTITKSTCQKLRCKESNGHEMIQS